MLENKLQRVMWISEVNKYFNIEKTAEMGNGMMEAEIFNYSCLLNHLFLLYIENTESQQKDVAKNADGKSLQCSYI